MAQIQFPSNDSNLPFWKRSHYLDRMTLGQLITAYFAQHSLLDIIGSSRESFTTQFTRQLQAALDKANWEVGGCRARVKVWVRVL